VLLAAVSLAAVAVYGVFAPGRAANWQDGSAVIVERESGARYVYAGGQLHPVPNYASALLVIGSAQARTVTVARSALAGVPRGAALGIPGAPDPLPPPDRLLPAPWAVCSGRLGDAAAQSTVYVGRVPGGGTELADPDGLLLTTADGTDYLVWRHHRYRVARIALGALAWGAEPPTLVTPALVNSLTAGPDLVAPTVPGQPGAPSKVPGARIGQVVSETVPGGGKQYAVALADGLAGVSEVQAALLLAQSGAAAVELSPAVFTGHLTGPLPTPAGATPLPDRRPELVRPHATDRGVCVTVGGGREGLSYDVPLSTEGVPVPSGSADRVVADRVVADRVVVDPGRGAVVAASASPTDPAASPTTPAALSVVSELGVRYPVPAADVLGILGYGGVTPVRLPSAVVSLLPVGPALDPTAARTPAGG